MGYLTIYLSIYLSLVFTNVEDKKRWEEEKRFLDICREGDLESAKTLLAEDPSLIRSNNGKGKMYLLYLCHI